MSDSTVRNCLKKWDRMVEAGEKRPRFFAGEGVRVSQEEFAKMAGVASTTVGRRKLVACDQFRSG